MNLEEVTIALFKSSLLVDSLEGLKFIKPSRSRNRIENFKILRESIPENQLIGVEFLCSINLLGEI